MAERIERAGDREARKSGEQRGRRGRGPMDPRREETRPWRREPDASAAALPRVLCVRHDDAGDRTVREQLARAFLGRVDASVVLDLAAELARDRGTDRGLRQERETRHATGAARLATVAARDLRARGADAQNARAAADAVLLGRLLHRGDDAWRETDRRDGEHARSRSRERRAERSGAASCGDDLDESGDAP